MARSKQQAANPADPSVVKKSLAATKQDKKDIKTKEKPPKKAVTKGTSTDADKKKKRRRSVRSLRAYVHKIVKGVEDASSVGKGAVVALTGLSEALIDKFGDEGKRLCESNKDRKTISASQIDRAVRLILPQEFIKPALEVANSALKSYEASLPAPKPKSTKSK